MRVDPHQGGAGVLGGNGRLVGDHLGDLAPAGAEDVALFNPSLARAPLGRNTPGRSGSGFGLGLRTMFLVRKSAKQIKSNSWTSQLAVV